MYSLIRRLLFLLDAEAAHDLTVAQMTRLQQIPLVLRASVAMRLKLPGRNFTGKRKVQGSLISIKVSFMLL